MGLLSVLDYAHRLVEAHLSNGGLAVDATVGNGMDTVFLAKLAGDSGKVFGFDIQFAALEITKSRLEKELQGSFTGQLFHESHERMKEVLPQATLGRISAVMFNLGYLPGINHQLVTKPETTLPALEAALVALRKGGIVTIVLYTGHPGAESEVTAVLNWAIQLPQKQFHVLRYEFMNQQNHPPFLIAIVKKE